LGSDSLRVLTERQSIKQPPYWPDRESRTAVLSALREHWVHRGWSLLAAHVRTNHVHAIVEADVRPERVMNEFKSYASGELNRLDRDGPDRKRWVRHESIRRLWNDEDVQQALQYVVEEQGEPMALFIADTL
jgi:REP element-mobilizing transposase RayT